MTTREDGNKNQIVTNIKYDQNSLSIFWKPLITKSKWHQIKFILKIFTGTFWNKIWDFSSMRLGNKSTRKEQKGQRLLKDCFFKKELNSNWLKKHYASNEIIERVSYTSIESNWGPSLSRICETTTKKRRVQAKTENLHEKLCRKTMSPQSIKYQADH